MFFIFSKGYEKDVVAILAHRHFDLAPTEVMSSGRFGPDQRARHGKTECDRVPQGIQPLVSGQLR